MQAETNGRFTLASPKGSMENSRGAQSSPRKKARPPQGPRRRASEGAPGAGPLTVDVYPLHYEKTNAWRLSRAVRGASSRQPERTGAPAASRPPGRTAKGRVSSGHPNALQRYREILVFKETPRW